MPYFWANFCGAVTPLRASACGAIGSRGAITEGDVLSGNSNDSVSALSNAERGSCGASTLMMARWQ